MFSNVWHLAVVAPALKKKRRLARRLETPNKSTKNASHSGARMTAVAPAIVPSSEVRPSQAGAPASKNADADDFRSWS